jgi:hypothetical protein
MHEARLVRFGAGKARLGAAFHALRVFVETLGLVLWHCAAPHVGCWHLARYGSTIGKLQQPTRICPSHVEGVPHGAGIRRFESSSPSQAVRRSEKSPLTVREMPANGGLLRFWQRSLGSRFRELRAGIAESPPPHTEIFPFFGDWRWRPGSIACVYRKPYPR